MSDLRIDVAINNVQIIKRSYALYRIDLTVTKNDGGSANYHSFRRFSEFLKLKQNLEQELGSELPYELPSRKLNKWLKPSSSCDPDVIETRKETLTEFLHDLLNDSFDTRWKRSPYVCHFLQLPSNWEDLTVGPRNRSSAAHNEPEKDSQQLTDPQKWLEEIRDCKLLLEESTRDPSTMNRVGVQIRLRLQKLEEALKVISENELVGSSEIQRRTHLLSGLKSELNQMVVNTNTNHYPSSTSSTGLFVAPSNHQKPAIGRKIGETSETLKLSDQELLQLHKDTTKDQDLELEQLRKMIMSQKELSLTMNQELSQQNELLDLMSGEVESTANKLRMANRSAKRINER
ncbi:LADA_0G15280g1_1 [Lachancea dasiensis]|uniref:LADA_0G15280g1_1 n=1 Tax=Lachancea dasiensis TaxID=1072105 RepID=A0A1G4JWP7_9SACH|nr:LADA_0G15280g1_1 [Lachancea dasiensis]